jgi:coenzyme F420 hydrogenase subunit beta
MRNLARIDERVEAQVPYLLTIFCGGLPTLATAEKIAESFELTEDELEIFRFRGEGWPGMTHMKTKDGRVFEITYDQAWYQDQPWTYDIQFRCKICPDAIGELADVACPDAWEMVDGEPVHEEGEGWNVILARTEKGAALVEQAVAAGYVTRAPYGIDEFDSQHTEHAWRKQANFARVLGLAAAGQPRPNYRNFRRLRTALGAGFGVNWRGFAGMLRRVRAGRNREPLV